MHLDTYYSSLKRPGADASSRSVMEQPEASWSRMQCKEDSWCTLWRPARGTICKGLCTSARRDWADLLETAARADLTYCNPQKGEPAAV